MSVRVAVVGVGAMGQRHARVFAAARGATLEGVYDADVHAARAAHVYGGAIFRSLDEAIAHAELVVIATPTALHHRQAKRALAAGRHVLVEKPLCATVDEASQLRDLSKAHARLFVGHSERFNPVIAALAAATRSDPITYMSTRRWGLHPVPREDVCLNLAVHDFDLARWLLGPVVVTSAEGDARRSSILLEGDSARAEIDVSDTGPQRSRTIMVRTREHRYEGDLLARTLFQDGVRVRLDEHEPLAEQARATLAMLGGAPGPTAEAADGVAVVEMAQRAMTLLAGGAFAAE